MECGQPQDIEGGTLSLTGIYYEDQATFRCNHGYVLEGQDVIRCEQTGQWEQRPRCRREKIYTNKH